MKSESLLSARSNLSQLSNVSYRGLKKQYDGEQFFRQSLPPGHYQKFKPNQIKQEQVELQSLGPSLFKNFTPVRDVASAFTPYWTTELHQNIEGTSDNQSQQQLPTIKKQQLPSQKLKIQQVSQNLQQFNSLSEKVQQVSKSVEQGEKPVKNETKNIPKNYGKAIIIFIENNREILQKVVQENGHNYDHILARLKNLKKKINTISDLRSLWEQLPQSKSLRIISNAFLRKYSLHYIYNSRIKTRLCHAKYKRRLQQAIVNPQDFNHIKDY